MKLLYAFTVVFVIVAISAKPGRKEDGKKEGIDRIKPVRTEKAVEFQTRIKEMVTECQTKIGEASIIASEAIGISGAELSKKITSIAEIFIDLQKKVMGSMIKGELLVMRTFLSGFRGEHVCKDVSIEDLEDQEEADTIDPAKRYFLNKKGLVTKARSTEGGSRERDELSEEDRPLVCLLKNIDNMMQAIMTISESIEEEVMNNPPTGQCDSTATYLLAPPTTISIEDQVFIGHMATDLSCMSERVKFFVERLNEKSDSIDMNNPREIKMAMMKFIMIFSTIVETTHDTVEPIFDVILTSLPTLLVDEVDDIKSSLKDGSPEEAIIGSIVEEPVVMKKKNSIKMFQRLLRKIKRSHH